MSQQLSDFGLTWKQLSVRGDGFMVMQASCLMKSLLGDCKECLSILVPPQASFGWPGNSRDLGLFPADRLEADSNPAHRGMPVRLSPVWFVSRSVPAIPILTRSGTQTGVDTRGRKPRELWSGEALGYDGVAALRRRPWRRDSSATAKTARPSPVRCLLASSSSSRR